MDFQSDAVWILLCQSLSPWRLPYLCTVGGEAESGMCSLGSSTHLRVAGGKLVICSSLNQHSEEIAAWQHLEESEAKDILGRLRVLLQRLGQNQDSIC